MEFLVSLPFSNSSERIHTVVTKETSGVKSWLDKIKIEPGLIVGLGVRWRYAFGKQREFDVAIMQLCVGRRCLIFQVGRADASVSALLSGFLNNRDVKIVGVGMEKPLQKLREDCGLDVVHAIDIGTLAAAKFAKPELRKAGMHELVTKLLGEQLPTQRRMRRSNWGKSVLSEEQVSHLCVESFLCCRLMEAVSEPMGI